MLNIKTSDDLYSASNVLSVKEVIEKLKTYDPNQPVLVFCSGSMYPVYEVTLTSIPNIQHTVAELGCGWSETRLDMITEIEEVN